MQLYNSLLALVGSMDFEVEIFERELEKVTEHTIEGIRFVSGDLFGQPVVLVCTGGGKVNAGITITLLIEHFKPSSVIFTGVAGGINPELKLGDVVIGETTLHHDFGEITPSQFIPWQTWEAGTGKRNPICFHADKALLSLANSLVERVKSHSINNTGLRQAQVINGVIVTGDVFCSSLEKKVELLKRFNAAAVEMDGAAVAQVCLGRGVGCLVIRGISDITEENAQEEYEKYCRLAIKNAAELTFSIIKAYKSSHLLLRSA